ncbi:hypothetical protein FOZ60_001450 [Perkinsus olseni]|uniref:Uncharacterized protein n=1 Tax=Perkinsus olseni TaxID=32597 RepID=A0A7J6PJK5_PEROL|nr:hypothetical protein FOZ60_001450 [Perkinsus olseni]
MRLHHQAPVRSLLLVLACQGRAMRGQPQPILLGQSEEGTRYYFEPWPKGTTINTGDMEHHTVDGFDCLYVRPHQEPCKDSKDCRLWMYTVDDVKGSKQHWAPGKTCSGKGFEAFRPVGDGRMSWDTEASPLPSNDPIVANANRLLKENQLMLATSQERPTPNGVYYGFVEGGLGATIVFDDKSQLKQVTLHDPGHVGYDEFIYTMLGEAIRGFFSKHKSSEGAALILEPVHPDEFRDSTRSFRQTRMNTIHGEPFDSNDLPKILGLDASGKIKAFKSNVRKSFRAVSKMASKLRPGSLARK